MCLNGVIKVTLISLSLSLSLSEKIKQEIERIREKKREITKLEEFLQNDSDFQSKFNFLIPTLILNFLCNSQQMLLAYKSRTFFSRMKFYSI